MADNAQKTPLARALNRFAEKKVAEAIQLLGKALPASVTAVSGSIVTVKFEVTTTLTLPPVTMPLAGAEYIRFPTQIGDKGLVFPADVYLGGVSGLGGGTADLSIPANLSALVFFPIGNKGWSTTDNPNAVVIYGPDGAIIRTKDSTCKITLSSTGVVVTLPSGMPMRVNGQLVVTGGMQINGSITAVGGGTFAGDFITSGNVKAGAGGADAVGLTTHIHPAPGGNTSPPTPGT